MSRTLSLVTKSSEIESRMMLLSCVLFFCISQVTVATLQGNISTKDSSVPISGRKHVQFTMKQGLIINQVIATYAISDAQNSLCKLHTEEFKRGLRSLEPWALQMFDSSSKLQSGILTGNLVEYGGFEQCIGIYKFTDNGPIRGKHCSFRIIPGEKLLKTVLGFRNVSHKRFDKIRSSVIEGVRLIWSVCSLDSCPADDLIRHFNRTIMELAQGLEIAVTLNEENCETSLTTPHWTPNEYSFLQTSSSCRIFSILSNGRKLLSTESSNRELNCLHGVRFISICYVMFGHRFMTGMLFPSINSLDLIDWILEYSSTVIIGGTISVDSFLFVSGLLVSYGFFEAITKRKQFNVLYFFLHRYTRITLPLSMAVILYCCFIQHFGSGPLWRETYTSMQLPCKYFWWSTLLHIQNYINPQHLCIPQAWYLTCEMLYYSFSPLLLYPLWRWPVVGYINFAFVYIISVAVNFYLAWENKYLGGMPLTFLQFVLSFRAIFLLGISGTYLMAGLDHAVPLLNQVFGTKYFQQHYIAPHVRASPYIIGLAFGYCIFRTKGKMYKIRFVLNFVCWAIAVVSMGAVVVGSHVFQQENHEYNRFESSIYLSCSRSAWVLGIAWIVWACVHGYGGFVNDILCLHVFRVLGRVGYGVFLFHMCFQFLKDGSAKMPAYFSNFYMLYNCFGDLVTILFIGTAFTLCFEYPLLGLEALVLRRKEFSNKVMKSAK